MMIDLLSLLVVHTDALQTFMSCAFMTSFVPLTVCDASSIWLDVWEGLVREGACTSLVIACETFYLVLNCAIELCHVSRTAHMPFCPPSIF